MRLWRRTGRFDPRLRGGFRHGKLAPHRDFILAAVAARDDVTMPELAKERSKAKGVKADPSTLSKFLIACGLSFKKFFGPANKTDLNWSRLAPRGETVSPSCANSVNGWSSSTKQARQQR